MSRHSTGMGLCALFLFLIPFAYSRQAPRDLEYLDKLIKEGSSRKSSSSSLRKSTCNGTETFACDDGRCIPRSWKCDGDIDCKGEEDEKDCNLEKCAEGEFKCGLLDSHSSFKANHNPCIPEKWRCDGEFDCDDRSDELSCDHVQCTENQFTCNEFDGQYKLCIPMTWHCDGQKDCASGEDEEHCEAKKCRDTDFQCANKVCIFKNWVCDGEDDCGDRSDEKNCTYSSQAQLCEEKSMFKCKKSDGCIPNDWVCDGEADCLDHSDERNCTDSKTQCRSPMEFACTTGTTCINRLWQCDGEEDCPDGSDEKNCASPAPCAESQFTCGNGLCIPQGFVCDNNRDCIDGSDEKNCTSSAATAACNSDTDYECASKPTQCIPMKEFCRTSSQSCPGDGHECRNETHFCKKDTFGCTCHPSYVKNTEVCYCKEGYRHIGGQNGSCADIDECEEKHGICDQTCTNTDGGYQCGCIKGYKLSLPPGGTIPNKCRAVGGDPIVLLSNRASIRQFDLVTNTYAPLITSPGSAVAMDFHLENRSLIWSDISQRKIMMCNIGNDSVDHHLASMKSCDKDKIYLVTDGVHTPDGLAVDWIHNLLFWTDGGHDQINVMDLETKKKRTLFHEELEEPRAIAVDPEMGLIFWSDWGKQARIERAGMNGQNRVVIVSGDGVKWPNGLALDYVNKRVYWADAKLKSIFSCDYWGKNIKTVLHSHDYLRHPFSMAVFEDRVYYTDWENDGVNSVNKFTGEDVKKVMQKVTTPMTVRIYHQQAQPALENKCVDHTCGTEQLCLPRAVYTELTQKEESVGKFRPFECACQTKIGTLVCALETAAEGAASGFSLSTMLFFLMLAIFTVTGVVYWRRRRESGTFTALNFDNPIYRRTTEQAEMDDPFRDPFSEETRNSRLVIGTQDADTEIQNAGLHI